MFGALFGWRGKGSEDRWGRGGSYSGSVARCWFTALSRLAVPIANRKCHRQRQRGSAKEQSLVRTSAYPSEHLGTNSR
jgi:hypothetical protein